MKKSAQKSNVSIYHFLGKGKDILEVTDFLVIETQDSDFNSILENKVGASNVDIVQTDVIFSSIAMDKTTDACSPGVNTTIERQSLDKTNFEGNGGWNQSPLLSLLILFLCGVYYCCLAVVFVLRFIAKQILALFSSSSQASKKKPVDDETVKTEISKFLKSIREPSQKSQNFNIFGEPIENKGKLFLDLPRKPDFYSKNPIYLPVEFPEKYGFIVSFSIFLGCKLFAFFKSQSV